MAKLQAFMPFDMSGEALTHVTDGTIDGQSTTNFHIDAGKFEAFVHGAFNEDATSGTIHGIDGLYKNRPYVQLTGLSSAVQVINEDGDNAAVLYAEFFDGRDKMVGSRGADGLFGFEGDDILKGGKGDDSLKGMQGADLLMGGAGADAFRYDDPSDSTQAAPDTILGLDAADEIDLRGFGVDGVAAKYLEAKDLTKVFIDLDGAPGAEMVIMIGGDHTDIIDSGQILT